MASIIRRAPAPRAAGREVSGRPVALAAPTTLRTLVGDGVNAVAEAGRLAALIAARRLSSMLSVSASPLCWTRAWILIPSALRAATLTRARCLSHVPVPFPRCRRQHRAHGEVHVDDDAEPVRRPSPGLVVEVPGPLVPQVMAAAVGHHLAARGVPPGLHELVHGGGPGCGAAPGLGALLVELVPPSVDRPGEPVVEDHAPARGARGRFADGGVLGEELVGGVRAFVVEAVHLEVGGPRGYRRVAHPAWRGGTRVGSMRVGEGRRRGGRGLGISRRDVSRRRGESLVPLSARVSGGGG